ncbi:MAG: glycosyltransferase family 4 protein [Candidatus Lokiarchaeota archaeon]|nr:glycosyltransferase family 4 protein [Candidatus Lokiarchaeota archaeon]
MRICQISPYISPPLGGAEIGALNWAKCLSEAHEVSIIGIKRTRDAKSYETIDNVKIFRVSDFRPWSYQTLPNANFLFRYSPVPLYFSVISFPSVFKLVSKQNPEILNLHYAIPLGLTSLITSRFLRIPLVITLIGADVYDPRFKYPTQYYFFLKKVLGFSDRIICISRSVKRHIVHHGIDEEKIKVIRYGVETDKFKLNSSARSEIRSKLEIDESTSVILTVQRLSTRKGVDYFLKSARIILRAFPSTKFLIIGDGPQRRFLENLARELKINKSVRFLGSIPHTSLPKFYNAADIFAFHTLYEGLGIVLLEAMASGLPIVTTIAGGTQDLIKNNWNGLLVRPKDPIAFAEAVLKLLRDKTLADKFAQKNRILAERSFSWKVIAKKIEKVFYELVK